MQQFACLKFCDLGGVLSRQTVSVVAAQVGAQRTFDARGLAKYAAAMNGDNDMVSLRRRNDTLFGVCRKPGVPDDVVVVGVDPGMQKLDRKSTRLNSSH